MSNRGCQARVVTIIALGYSLGCTCAVAASATAELEVAVNDPSDSAVSGATVTVQPQHSHIKRMSLHTKQDGKTKFEVSAGRYIVECEMKGFTPFRQEVTLGDGESRVLPIRLQIAVVQQNVEVQDSNVLESSSNKNQVIIKERALDAFSDDPDELRAELEELSGPGAGPNGGQIYIDGFLGGQLPPKASIREIRVNQNPFSAQFDKLGYGRTEIFTKPGTDRLHAQFLITGNDSAFNARNPYGGAKPSYHSELYSGVLSGALSKKISFFATFEKQNFQNVAAVDALVLAPNGSPVTEQQNVPNPQDRLNASGRLDIQVNQANVLGIRYQLTNLSDQNDGVGQLALASQGYDSYTHENTVQLSDTQILGAKAINETRLSFTQTDTRQDAVSPDHGIVVLGAFIGGGNTIGNTTNALSRVELQNYSSYSSPAHFWRWGGILRLNMADTTSTQDFNGYFTFASLSAYAVTESGLAEGLTPEQIQMNGGGAAQYLVRSGQPNLSNTYLEAALYVEDTWKVRKNFNLTYGLRVETQNDIPLRPNFAPRIGMAWTPRRMGDRSALVLRGGFGIFYDRFDQGNVLLANRLNGILQQQFTIDSPDTFPNTPVLGPDAQAFRTIYVPDPGLRAPYTIQSAVSAEKSIHGHGSVSVTYLNSRGVHQLLSRNINAPLTDTYVPDDPLSGMRPFGLIGNLYQFEAPGIFRQNQIVTNVNIALGSRIVLFGSYAFGYAKSDTNGAMSFPSNQYDLSLDYGRAGFDIRHRVLVGGSIALPDGFRLSPLILGHFGIPLDITTGLDLNGDGIFNDRPSFGTSLSNNVLVTRYGVFNPTPGADEPRIPINYASSPNLFSMNLRLSRTFILAHKPGDQSLARSESGHGDGGHSVGGAVFSHGGGHGDSETGPGPLKLTFSVAAENIFNRVNSAPPIAVLGSPLFGMSDALAPPPFSSPSANRRINLGMTFAF